MGYYARFRKKTKADRELEGCLLLPFKIIVYWPFYILKFLFGRKK